MTRLFHLQLISRLAAAPAEGEHPDAEALSGFREHRLNAVRRKAVAVHLATCGECREMLALTASVAEEESPSGSRGHVLRWGVALAACALLFCGVTSLQDDGVIQHLMDARMAQVESALRSGEPKVSYTVATIRNGEDAVAWRIRPSGGSDRTLEYSVDFGRSWRRAKIDRPFEPEAVGYRGRDVWVKSRSGEMLVSRDAGLHWTALQPGKGR